MDFFFYGFSEGSAYIKRKYTPDTRTDKFCPRKK